MARSYIDREARGIFDAFVRIAFSLGGQGAERPSAIMRAHNLVWAHPRKTIAVTAATPFAIATSGSEHSLFLHSARDD